MVYKINDPKQKSGPILTVDFYFDSGTTSNEAKTEIAKLVRLADNNSELTFTGYQPQFWSFNPTMEEEE
mgnify:CR=1 FL=1